MDRQYDRQIQTDGLGNWGSYFYGYLGVWLVRRVVDSAYVHPRTAPRRATQKRHASGNSTRFGFCMRDTPTIMMR